MKSLPATTAPPTDTPPTDIGITTAAADLAELHAERSTLRQRIAEVRKRARRDATRGADYAALRAEEILLDDDLAAATKAAADAHAAAVAAELDRSLDAVRPTCEALDVDLADARWVHVDSGDALRSVQARRDSAVQMFAQNFAHVDSPRVVTDVLGTRVDGYMLRLHHGPTVALAAATAAPLLRLGNFPQVAATLASIGTDAPRRPTPTTETDPQ
jgi:hypothetical protein